MSHRQKGQGMIEFVLISPVLLLTILAIIETALIFQGYLTVQHAAREAARWAITYKPDKRMNLDGNPCDPVADGCDPNETDEEYRARRVDLIKRKAVDNAVGLHFDRENPVFDFDLFDDFAKQPDFFGVEVFGGAAFVEPEDGWTGGDMRDHPGLPGLSVRVRVTHNVELLDPLFRAIVPRVRVVAQAEMINQGTQAGYGDVAPPASPPSPRATQGGMMIPTQTPTSIEKAGPSPSATTTPAAAFIALSDYRVVPTDFVLIDVNQHDQGIFALRWVDDSLGLVAVISPALTIGATGVARNIPFTVPDASQGIYYVETWQGERVVARSTPVEVMPPPPDLVVRSIGFSEAITPNQEILVTVEVQNLTAGSVTGFFDVDVYVMDPDSFPPEANRPGNSRQWLEGIGARQTKVITHVVTLPGGALCELWARVDASNQVSEELDKANNISAPVPIQVGGNGPSCELLQARPPRFKECVQVIELGDFEASVISPPWKHNVDVSHASDRKHSGSFSLQFRARASKAPAYRHLRPWAYQTVRVPDHVLPETTGTLTYWQLVLPHPEGGTPDAGDRFYLAIRDSAGMTLTAGIPLADGDKSTAGFQHNAVTVPAIFAESAGEEIQIQFYAVHDGDESGTDFFVDDIGFDICTTQPEPEDIPGTSSFGGLVQVLLGGRPIHSTAIPVWAFAPDGELVHTTTIHDSTYHFYNVSPASYTIYAEVWMGGVLYASSAEVDVTAGEHNYAVDLLLQ